MQLHGGAAYGSFQACTPSDTTLVTCRGIFSGVAGNLVIAKDANTPGVTFAVLAGSTISIMLEQGRVMAASTASGIVLLA